MRKPFFEELEIADVKRLVAKRHFISWGFTDPGEDEVKSFVAQDFRRKPRESPDKRPEKFFKIIRYDVRQDRFLEQLARSFVQQDNIHNDNNDDIDYRIVQSPSPFKPETPFADKNYFLRHGEVIRMNVDSIKEALESRKETPYSLLIKELQKKKTSTETYAGFYFPQLVGNERGLQYNLVDLIGGTKLFAYSESLRLGLNDSNRMPENFYAEQMDNLPGIKIQKYTKADGVILVGGQTEIDVPSMTSGKVRYPMLLSGIPVTNMRHAYSPRSDHYCLDKRNRNKMFPTPKDPLLRAFACKHDIGALLAVEDYFWRAQCDGVQNTIPTRASMLALPSKSLVDLYNEMQQRWIIKELDGIDRRPNEAECQAVLDTMVRKVLLPQNSFVQQRYDSKGEHIVNSYDWT